jgi:carbonic anhydrase/acetyltransferase-like protein (isoleucine patch superfamily)
VDKLKLVLGGLGAFVGAGMIGLLVVLAREAKQAGKDVTALQHQVGALQLLLADGEARGRMGQGRTNVLTSFNADVDTPKFKETSFVDPMASVIGDVALGSDVYVAPFASIRGDEGQPISVGDESNVQDGVVIHALETTDHGQPVPNRTYMVNGKAYAVYIGKRVSLAHQSQVHGPARIDDDVFIGMQALIFKSWVGRGSVIEPGAKLIGVTVPPGRYVKAGTVLTDQKLADDLPVITEVYPFAGLNEAVVHVNTTFAEQYGELARPKPAAAEGEAGHAPGEVAAAEATHH